MLSQLHFSVGQRIALAKTSPIESEGVAPEPGAKGSLIEAPAASDSRHCWGVKFDNYSLIWQIPEKFLTRLD